MKRRTFLKRGLLGGALLLLGAGGLALVPTLDTATPARALHVLDARGFHILVAIARRVVTAKGADAIAIAHGVDDSLTTLPPEARGDIKNLLLLFENALSGLLFDRRWKPFTRLSPSEQDKVLVAWRDSKIALRCTGYQALRKLCLAAHYRIPSSWAAVHYPTPTPVGEPYDDSKMGTPEWNAAHGLEGPP